MGENEPIKNKEKKRVKKRDNWEKCYRVAIYSVMVNNKRLFRIHCQMQTIVIPNRCPSTPSQQWLLMIHCGMREQKKCND